MAIQPSKRRKPITTSMLLMAAGLFVTTPLQAEEALPTVVVTAGRIAEDPARISADVTLIDEEEIKKSQVTSVAELLRRQVGINTSSTGGPGKSTSLYMRGGNSGHVLVLIDGIRVGAASTGAFDWALMSAEDIERIEIVRGPQSSLYGADAMSGVIQIFTKTGEGKAKVRINGEAGGLASSRGSMQVSGSTEDGISYALTAAGQRTAGVSVAANGTERDPFRQTQLSGRIEMEIGDGTLAFTGRQSEGTTGLDGGWVLADTLNWNASSRQSAYSAKLSYPVMDNWESSLQLSRSADDMSSNDPANAANNSDIHTTINQLNWQNSVELADFSLLFGFDHHADRVVNQLAPLNKVLRQSAGFASLSWHGEMIDLNGSVRHDRNSGLTNSANKSTWHTGGVLRPVEGLKLSANYGTGFKAPSINDLYWPGAGNANLKPETSKGWDAGIAYERSGEAVTYAFSATWFDQSFSDLIAWAPITPGSWTWIPSNVNKARSRGLELSGKLSFSGAYLQANWGYLLARDTGNETWLARRPKEHGNILIGIDVGPLNLEGNLAIVGPRFSSPNNSAYLASYRKTDLRARYKINPAWELTARVDNIENKKYEEAAGYGVPGRAWYAGAGASF
ncbi:vitamin B12 transporter [Mariprofundus aestuarium]|uniref:Vitamin B12 transporter n=1 Tax=Mariprofundus aestuarium TaxID=1921086 RepID=A0A2K8KYY8_MARES|nr:TonB-dependent receptor [Mariprofundus aestuarium]ATX78731.1 vitamin B12 transporter [Mariprofundus aestuarium]